MNRCVLCGAEADLQSSVDIVSCTPRGAAKLTTVLVPLPFVFFVCVICLEEALPNIPIPDIDDSDRVLS